MLLPHDALADRSRKDVLLVVVAWLMKYLHTRHREGAHFLANGCDLVGVLNEDVKLAADQNQ